MAARSRRDARRAVGGRKQSGTRATGAARTRRRKFDKARLGAQSVCTRRRVLGLGSGCSASQPTGGRAWRAATLHFEKRRRSTARSGTSEIAPLPTCQIAIIWQLEAIRIPARPSCLAGLRPFGRSPACGGRDPAVRRSPGRWRVRYRIPGVGVDPGTVQRISRRGVAVRRG